MPVYADKPVAFVHELIVGDDYRPVVVCRLKDADGAYYSLVGALGIAKLKREFGGQTLLTPTVTFGSDATSDYFYWTAPAAETELLSPMEAALSIRLTFGDGTKKTVIRTLLTIAPDGTL